MSKPYPSVKDAFNRGLDEITHDKRLRESLNKRLDEHDRNGGDAEAMAGGLFLEASIQFEDPDTKYYDAKEVFDRTLNGTRARKAKRDAKEHPGRHRSTPNDFVRKTEDRLGSIEEWRTGADSLLRQLAVRVPADSATRAKVIALRREMDELDRDYDRSEPSDHDDPVVKEAKGEKRTKLDKRLKSLYRAAEQLVEPVERDVALHARVIDDQNLQLGDHNSRLEQHDTMLREHDVVVSKVKAGLDTTAHAALVALVTGAGLGFVAFLIKLLIHLPDVVVRKETVRGVSITQIIPSPFNGFWPAVVTGLIVGVLTLLIVYIIGLVAADRHEETDGAQTGSTKRYHFFERTKAKETEAAHRTQHPVPDTNPEPDSIDALGLSESDTTPTQAHA